MRTATIRNNGKKHLTVKVEFYPNLRTMVLAYILEVCPSRMHEELENIDVKGITKRKIVEGVCNTFYAYGTTFDEMDKDFVPMNYDGQTLFHHPKVVALTKRINELFDFE